ncbi:MAG: cytochrome c biogenesis protein CcdA [Magnetococcales bacterium]|nr:cytochrome c biogenesis protein CcdA [Magnetococcales bacterium]
MDESVSLLTALLAGLLSFLSPCVLPLVPAYLSFMSGVSVDGLKGVETATDRQAAWRAVPHALAFVLGFSTVFVLLGASATLAGRWLLAHVAQLGQLGGAVIILLGLHYIGLFRLRFLDVDARFHNTGQPAGWVGSYVIGLSFAFGWTPCVGPILAGILGLAGGLETVGQGIVLLAVYSAGLGIPFIIAGLAVNLFFAFFTRMRRHLHTVEVISGILLTLVGVMILLGDLNRLSVLILEWFPSLATLG